MNNKECSKVKAIKTDFIVQLAVKHGSILRYIRGTLVRSNGLVLRAHVVDREI